jgi:hypothetical protein
MFAIEKKKINWFRGSGLAIAIDVVAFILSFSPLICVQSLSKT